MILINGEHKQHIDSVDRGLQYGDGLFETIEVKQSRPLFLEQHLQRLQLGCERLYIPCPDLDLLRQEAYRLCHESGQSVLKIIVTRGCGGRGYRQPAEIKPTRILSLHPYPEYPCAYDQQGISVRFCQTRLGRNPALAGIKHLNRLEQVLARAEWSDPDIQEGLMLDDDENVIEGTMSNLFYFKQGSWYTPSLAEAGVAGIMRGLVIKLLAEQASEVVVGTVSRSALFEAEELLVCNSIIGIWPVTKLEQLQLPIGPETKRLQQHLAQLKKECLGNES